MDRANSPMRPMIAVCVPAHNEEKTIRYIVNKILLLNKLLTYRKYYVIVVDNGSTDKTPLILKELKKRHKGFLHVIYEPYGCGITGAYRTAFKYALEAGYDIIVGMDAGLSHDPADLVSCVYMLNDNDCVFGSRTLGAYVADKRRKALSKLGTIAARVLLGLHLTDATSGFSAFRRAALERIALDSFKSKWHFYDTELKYHAIKLCNLSYNEFAIAYRSTGSSLKAYYVLEAIKLLIYYSVIRLTRALNDTKNNRGAVSFFP